MIKQLKKIISAIKNDIVQELGDEITLPIKDALREIVDAVKSALKEIVKKAKEGIDEIVDAIKAAIRDIVSALKESIHVTRQETREIPRPSNCSIFKPKDEAFGREHDNLSAKKMSGK